MRFAALNLVLVSVCIRMMKLTWRTTKPSVLTTRTFASFLRGAFSSPIYTHDSQFPFLCALTVLVFIPCSMLVFIISSHNLFKGSKTEHSSPTGSFVSCYSPPKLSTMGHDRKQLYRRNLFSASSPELFNSLAPSASASGGRTSPLLPFLQVVGPSSTSASSSSSSSSHSPPSFFTFASSSTPLLQPKEKRFSFLTPPTSSETSPATSPPLSPRTRDLARHSETGFSIRRSVSTSDVRIDPSRASKRLKLSPIPLPKLFDS
eukprot:TRINITY_DN267_c0_g1_i2.p2 TRINITY_DN267_c0_g1~~TRINITY_DN267_c0_g1_i2.p2  ORF type:complete len:261 (+),score=56.03 TRINITY_DN267_c0_g1_i2:885-1667(+)